MRLIWAGRDTGLHVRQEKFFIAAWACMDDGRERACFHGPSPCAVVIGHGNVRACILICSVPLPFLACKNTESWKPFLLSESVLCCIEATWLLLLCKHAIIAL